MKSYRDEILPRISRITVTASPGEADQFLQDGRLLLDMYRDSDNTLLFVHCDMRPSELVKFEAELGRKEAL